MERNHTLRAQTPDPVKAFRDLHNSSPQLLNIVEEEGISCTFLLIRIAKLSCFEVTPGGLVEEECFDEEGGEEAGTQGCEGP